jgi:hypothetical protein
MEYNKLNACRKKKPLTPPLNDATSFVSNALTSLEDAERRESRSVSILIAISSFII